MLAARHREDHGRLPAHRSLERGIGRGVARMQRDDEIGLVAAVVGDVPYLEAKPLGAEPPGERLAGRDHVLLEVETDQVHRPPVHGCQQVMQRERQIRLARAEVDDAQLALAAAPAARPRRARGSG